MNDALLTQVTRLAVMATAEMFAAGHGGEAATFETTAKDAGKMIGDVVARIAAGLRDASPKVIGVRGAVLLTGHTKPRSGSATPKAGGTRNAVSQEELLTFLGNTTKELKEVVDRFSVSPGIANRALKKAIKDGKVESKAGVAVPGKKGKPAALFFVK